MQPPPQGHSSSANLPPSSHRLATVSAADALKTLQNDAPRPLKTGISQLDAVLSSTAAPNGTVTGMLPGSKAGSARGSIVELWGPSGSGKTTLGLQLALDAIKADGHVLWVDLATPVCKSRLSNIIPSTALRNLHHLSLPTLSHLLVLLAHPPPSLLPQLSSLSLLILDNLHAPLDAALPRQPTSSSTTTSGVDRDAARWAASRRFGIQAHIGSELRRWAATYGCAVAVTSNAVSRGRWHDGGGSSRGAGAVLASALAGGLEWEGCVTHRLVLFRDFGSAKQQQQQQQAGRALHEQGPARYVGVTKLGGTRLVSGDGDVGVVVAFAIGDKGIVDPYRAAVRGALEPLDDGDDAPGHEHGASLEAVDSPPLLPDGPALPYSSPVRIIRQTSSGEAVVLSGETTKRKFDEVADSEDEEGLSEYGWDEDDGLAAEGLVMGEAGMPAAGEEGTGEQEKTVFED